MVILRMPERVKPSFSRYIGIDYSGAETPSSSLKGIRVYQVSRESLPMEVEPLPSPRKYWTHRGLAEWLLERLSEDVATLVGIDHGFSFPLRYFEVHYLKPDWPIFLDDYQKHWPTDAEQTYVDFVRDGLRGNGRARPGNTRWRRITEERVGAKSVFHFDVPGSVPNPLMPDCLGCFTCEISSASGSTSGLSTAGRFLRANPRWWRFTHRCGARVVHGRVARPTSRTPMPPPLGYGRWTLMVASENS